MKGNKTNLEIKKDINKELKVMIKENVISKDDLEAAKTVMTWLRLGKMEAMEINKKYVKNLTDNGFANKNGYLIRGEDDDEALWFILAVAGAKGHIEQCGTN